MFLMGFRANTYTNQMLCFLTVYLCVSLFGYGFRGWSFCCFCFVLCWMGGFFSCFWYLIRAGARFLCVQLVFCCSLVWFWIHWRTAHTAAACCFCAQDPAASEVNAKKLPCVNKDEKYISSPI